MFSTSDTIIAISTAKGMGAIAVIRLSGDNAIKLVEKQFKPFKSNKLLTQQKGNTIHYGTLVDENKDIDDVLISVFKAPHCYTGQNTVEIACHGATYIQQEILMLFVKHGARLANPGEFTQRAFLNGKMDLLQAEAVADLISSSSEASRKVALQQMRGGFSNELTQLREKLLWFASLIELELDFAEEEVEFANRKELNALVEDMLVLITKLCQSFALGNAIKNGIPVAIVGNTNAGKSTLLNALLNEERALVSDVHGTTRDTVEDTIHISGITFRFIDTAGIRQTADVVENMGIERTFDKIQKATVVILLVDANDSAEKIAELLKRVSQEMDFTSQQLLFVVNKIDDIKEGNTIEIFNSEPLKSLLSAAKRVDISAKNKLHIEELKEALLSQLDLQQLESDDIIVTNARHYEHLTNAHTALSRANDGLHSGLPSDLVAQDIRETIDHLGSITGIISSDNILHNIFKHFCIGK